MQILFHGTTGPFRIQTKTAIDAAWVDVTGAIVTEVKENDKGTGVFTALIPGAGVPEDLGFYRIVSEGDPTSELKGWTFLVRVSAPLNGTHFVQGEAPIVTVTILDTLGQGISKTDFSSLNLYMYGPQETLLATTAAKLLNVSTDRTKTPHHYVDLKSNTAVEMTGKTVLTYRLQPVTDELPGTYTVGVRAVLAADEIQQMLKFANVQIGTATAENPVVTKAQCAACHEGTISGKMYMHHVDVGRSPVGSWSLDYQPPTSCKLCHNNNGYAAYNDASVTGGKVPDALVLRVHGVHMGEGLKSDFNTNSVSGNFRSYTPVVFPSDVRDCTKCHVDDRWKTQPSRMACGSCHDNIWFGPAPAPGGLVAHDGGKQLTDKLCAVCHDADYVIEKHRIPPPSMDVIDVTMTPPLNGTHYVAGEQPVVTIVIKDDATNAIDHTKVTDVNFSTASLFVYGPRSHAMPVLTSAAKNLSSKLRASVTSSLAGPWAINGKIFKIAVNGSAPQEIPIVGASSLVTAAEVVTSLNTVITNLGAKASISGANVNIRTVIQGANARFEIYNGDVTSLMGWKRAPNTTMDPDVTVAAAFTPSNDLRGLSDPLDYSDPKVTRTAANITYQLDDVAGLAPGTYGIYVYQIPKAGKIAGLAAPTGIGHMMFQVGTKTAEKKVATNCADCHGDTIFHLYSGPIHAEPFDTDYCNACHDYGHPSTGDMFKNQGGTSLNGWSGYGAMPIVRRVHGVHNGRYLQHPEEIYANATKATFGEIIFPQDIRNCTKCHAESDTWKQKPSRVACMACHDSDEAKAHGKLMTFMMDPDDPYGPNAIESCEVCHGPGTEFSADKVHGISNPYVPPYPREPAQ